LLYFHANYSQKFNKNIFVDFYFIRLVAEEIVFAKSSS